MAQRLEELKPGCTDQTIRSIEAKISAHHMAIMSSDWRSLPELTNANGEVSDDEVFRRSFM